MTHTPGVTQEEWVRRTQDVRHWLKVNKGALAPRVYSDIRNLIKLGATHINERPSLLLDIEHKLSLYVSEATTDSHGRSIAPLMDKDPDFYERLCHWLDERNFKLESERQRLRNGHAIIHGRFHQGTAAKSPAPARAVSRAPAAPPTQSAPTLPPLGRSGGSAHHTRSLRKSSLPHAPSSKGMTRSTSDSGISDMDRSTSAAGHGVSARAGSARAPPPPHRATHVPSSIAGASSRRARSVPPAQEHNGGSNARYASSASPSRHSQASSNVGSGSRGRGRKAPSSASKKKGGKKRRASSKTHNESTVPVAPAPAPVAPAPEDIPAEDLIADEQVTQFRRLRDTFSRTVEEITQLADKFREVSRDEEGLVSRVVSEEDFINVVKDIGITDPRRASSIYNSYDRDRLYNMVAYRDFLADLAFLSNLPIEQRTQVAFSVFDLDGDGLLLHSELVSLLDRVVKMSTLRVDKNGNLLTTQDSSPADIDSQSDNGDDLLRAIDMMFRSVDRDGDSRISFQEFHQAFIEFDFIGRHLSPRFNPEPLSRVRGARQHLILEAMEDGRVAKEKAEAISRRDAAYLRKLNFHFAPQSTDRQGIFVVSPNASEYGVHIFPLSSETKGVHFVVGKSATQTKTELLFVKFDRAFFSEVEAATWWALHGRRYIGNSYFESVLCGPHLSRSNSGSRLAAEDTNGDISDFDEALSSSDDEEDTGDNNTEGAHHASATRRTTAKAQFNNGGGLNRSPSDKENGTAAYDGYQAPVYKGGMGGKTVKVPAVPAEARDDQQEVHSPVVTVAVRKFASPLNQ
eukprot:TRINITY_DN2797_c0_g1_i2.p1 TRINITY_DN2797_c0_g1~~TRINITY_DN2797_c0_g1_i2.p1  ORF type:complete len:799 (+),score=176.77 TRINITY_DN2797_c0_g1_i2:162-2558(+)